MRWNSISGSLLFGLRLTCVNYRSAHFVVIFICLVVFLSFHRSRYVFLIQHVTWSSSSILVCVFTKSYHDLVSVYEKCTKVLRNCWFPFLCVCAKGLTHSAQVGVHILMVLLPFIQCRVSHVGPLERCTRAHTQRFITRDSLVVYRLQLNFSNIKLQTEQGLSCWDPSTRTHAQTRVVFMNKGSWLISIFHQANIFYLSDFWLKKMIWNKLNFIFFVHNMIMNLRFQILL